MNREKEEIHRLYWEEELTLTEVGQKLGLSYQKVQRRLDSKRSLSEAQENRTLEQSKSIFYIREN